MGFYGMLVGAVAVLSALLISSMLYQASVLNMFSSQFVLYSNMQNVGAFERMVNATMPSNASDYSAWLSALYLSAKADGITIKVANSTIAISTVTFPRAYAVMRLKA
jgi:hypothetical protein